MLDALDLTLRLGTSVVAGALIGVDRELHANPVGIRVLGLVGLGAALATLAGSGFSGDATDANASRVIQGIVTGIGFLGAGVIVRGPADREVHGLTTAAAIWVTASLGIASGLGAYLPVLLGAALMLVVIVVGGWLDRFLHERMSRKTKPGTDASGNGP